MIFSVTASPADAMVIVFSADQEESEELSSGSPAIIDLGMSKAFRFSKLESLHVDSNAIWKNDGHHVLFETTKGVFEADTGHLDDSPKMIIAGKTHGIALSKNESKLAFWRWEKSSLQLVVRDTASSSILKKWTLPYAYGGEANGSRLLS